MRVYQTRAFAQFTRKAGLTARALLKAAREVAEGRYDADLGGGVFKQRVARAGGGKSGGFRTVLAVKRGEHCFFLHGYAKNEKANVSAKELKALKGAANEYFAFSAVELREAVSSGMLIVVNDDGD